MLNLEVSMRTRRQFSREYKLSVLQAILSGDKTLMQVSRELEIGRGLLQRWKQEYLASESHSFPGSGHQPPADAEKASLLRELRTLRQENEILKKALAIFSQGPTRGTV